MNQILVTQKLYVTPELKRKKKLYKFNFMLSIFLIIVLFSAYIYAEYDRNKSEEVSQDILSNIEISTIEGDETTIAEQADTWVFVLNATGNSNMNIEEVAREIEEDNGNVQNNQKVGKYTSSDGSTYNTVGTIIIPSINVEYPILTETTDALLKISVCKFWGSNPNEVGNLCIAGHNYRNSRFFSKVPNLATGDTIQIKDLSNNTVNYTVFDKYTVDPTDVSCTSQITNGKKIVTLITCTNDSKQRVVVKAVAQ